MDFFNKILGRVPPSALLIIPPPDPLPLGLQCPASSCSKHISWEEVELKHSKKTYACPYCQYVFCLACRNPPSTYSDHESTSECLLNSTATGALSNLLHFHEAVLVLKDLCITKKLFESLPRSDTPDPEFLKEVDDAVKRTEITMEDSRRSVGDYYTMIIKAQEERLEKFAIRAGRVV